MALRRDAGERAELSPPTGLAGSLGLSRTTGIKGHMCSSSGTGREDDGTQQAAGARVQALRGRALRPLSESVLWPPVCGAIRPRPVDDPAAQELASLGVSAVRRLVATRFAGSLGLRS